MNNNNLKKPVNLIGINGKIGSGKDTVGKIIQYLIANNNLPKNMQYDSLEELDNGTEKFSNWEIKKFAGKVKEIASILTGIPIEKFENQEFKKTTLPEEWDFADNNAPDNIMTIRMFLQKLGTEAMRDGLHTNVWVNALFADYKTSSIVEEKRGDNLVWSRDVYPNWIITDMRFPNEMKAVVEKNGITIRVNRPGISLLDHPSETSLDTAEFDYTIVNDSTIEDLVIKVREILVKEKII
jgi:hypothetical protein